jgi:two-component system, OmpR family, phosphate regulon response regulator OmpR
MGSSRTILIVEDVDTMRSLLAHLVNGIPGVTVSGLARNTAEARLEVSRRRPDLVLLDEILPGESGLDLLEDLDREGIPVILLTGVEHPDHRVPAQAAMRLTKPDWNEIEAGRARFAAAIANALSPPV